MCRVQVPNKVVSRSKPVLKDRRMSQQYLVLLRAVNFREKLGSEGGIELVGRGTGEH